jgi:signal transduction histidine kinase
VRDLDKTKAQLVEELDGLRKRLGELEADPGSSRLLEQQEVLLGLALQSDLFRGDIDTALRTITEAAGECLTVARTSIWVYDTDRTLIRCLDLFDRDNGAHSSGVELGEVDYPAYFRALARERAIAAHDAHEDPRTREFSDSYLRPLGINSMLDAPIRVHGVMRGVICHEHVGPQRTWSAEEQGFAGSIGDLVALAVAADERRRADEQRRLIESRMLQAQKLESLGVLAGGIAHDFNNLLVGILGNAGLALDELSPVSAARESIEGIETAARRAAELCHQMLAYSGKGRFVVETVCLNDVVGEMAHLLDVSVSKAATLKYDLAPDIPGIEADATQLRQVIMNLMTNASEAIEGSGVISISTGAMHCDREYLDALFVGEDLKEGGYVFFEVSDTGCGMDQATVEKIFEPFFTSKFTGRGLGLAAVQGIVRGHGGSIRIYTEVGKGTTFKVLLPASDQEARGLQRPADRAPDWKASGTVLVVDDDQTVRSVARRMLERVGLEVLTACDGREALEVLREHRDEIVCILLDLTMPNMGGEEAFSELRRVREDVPIVLSSGYNEQDAISRFAGKGLAGFVKKPYLARELIGRVREVLGD